jgi:hypothetical protein
LAFRVLLVTGSYHIYHIQLIKGLSMQMSSQPPSIIHLPFDVDLLDCECSNEIGVDQHFPLDSILH